MYSALRLGRGRQKVELQGARTRALRGFLSLQIRPTAASERQSKLGGTPARPPCRKIWEHDLAPQNGRGKGRADEHGSRPERRQPEFSLHSRGARQAAPEP